MLERGRFLLIGAARRHRSRPGLFRLALGLISLGARVFILLVRRICDRLGLACARQGLACAPLRLARGAPGKLNPFLSGLKRRTAYSALFHRRLGERADGRARQQ